MPAPAGYEIVPAPAKPPAGYDIVPAPPPSMTVAAPAQPDQRGVTTGFLQSVGLPSSWDEVKGLYHTIADSPTPTDFGARMGQATREAVVHGAKAMNEEIGDAAQNIKDQQPLLPNLGKMGYAAVHGAASIAPGGTGVENFATDFSSGNYRGATGDALGTVVNALMLGRKGPPKPETAVNKLGYAAGGEVPAIRAALPEIQKTVGDKGISTVGDLAKAVQETSTRLNQKFNSGLMRMKGQFVPTEIADALEARAKMQSPSADGQAIAAELRSMISDYQKPWTDVQLNQERMLRNGMSKGFFNKSGSGQMAAMRSSAQTIADQIIDNEAKELLYGRMERAMPGQGFQALKQSQSHLIDVMDQLDAQIGRLETQQAKFKGAPLLEKPGFTSSVSPHGITPRVHLGSFIESLAGKGPMDKANAAVSAALPDIASATGKRRATILALPISRLAPPAVPPPPSTEP